MTITKMVREVTGMVLIFMAGSYQEHNWVAGRHFTVGNFAVAAGLVVAGRIIFGKRSRPCRYPEG